MAKIRNEMRSIAVENTMKVFEKEKIFTKIFERMGEENMIDATIDMNKEESIEGIYAEFVLTVLNEKRAKEEAKKASRRSKRTDKKRKRRKRKN